MSQQEPAVYNLEFFGDAAFWDGAGDGARRTFFMPLPNPAEFLAFGVVGPSTTVHFVARGRMREHLGDFTARMVQAGATVELYARPPLPWRLVKRYTSDDPYEGSEPKDPKSPPVNGFVSYGTGSTATASTTQPITESVAWPSSSDREVVVMPLNDTEEFLAFGVSGSPEAIVFVARGSLGAHLGGFIDQMKLDGASLQLCDWPTQQCLRDYLDEKASVLFTPTTLVAGTRSLAETSAVASA